MTRWKRVLLSAGWTAGLVGVVIVLWRLGSGALSAPPIADAARLRIWMDERDAVTVAFAVLRLVALVVGGYLLAVTVLGILARASHIPVLVALADLSTVPAVRRLLAAAAGVGLTASVATLVVAPGLGRDRPAATAPGQAATGALVIERLADGSTMMLERLPDDDDATATMSVVPPDDAQAPGPRAWTAAAGDHFWHIAEATLTEAWQRPPTDAEVAPYWKIMVDTNRTRLVDRANPDLIYVGQVFLLPEPPPRR